MDDARPLSLDKSQIETPVDNSRTAKGVLLERAVVRVAVDVEAVKDSPMPPPPWAEGV